MSTHEGIRAFVRDVSLYGAQNLASRVGQFLLLPIYLKYLGPEDFGVLAITTIFAALAGVFVGFSLDAAVLRFYHEWRPSERALRLGTVWLFTVVCALASTVLIGFLGQNWAWAVIRQVPYDPYLRLALWTVFFTTLEGIPLAVLRARQASAAYSVQTVGAFLLTEGLKIYALIVLQTGVLGIIQAGLIASVFRALIAAIWLAPSVRLGMKVEYLGESLRFALPRIPGGILETLATVLDRLALEKFIPISQLGGYEVARRLGSVVREANIPLKTAWLPYAIRVADEHSAAPHHLARMSTYYLAVVFGVAAVLAIVSREVLTILGEGRYVSTWPLVPLFAAIFSLDAAISLLGINLYIARRTGAASLAVTFSFLVLLAGMVTLVPLYGIPGAVGALFLYRLSQGLLLFFLSRVHYPVPYAWRTLMCMVGLTLGLVALGMRIVIANVWLSFLAKGVLVGAAGLVAALIILDGSAAYAVLRREQGRRARGELSDAGAPTMVLLPRPLEWLCLLREIGRDAVGLLVDRARRSRERVMQEYDRGVWKTALAQQRWRRAATLDEYLTPGGHMTRLATIEGRLVRIPSADYYHYRNGMLRSVLEEWAGDANELVELGCGAGFNLFVLSQSGRWRRLYGLDLSENALAVAREVARHFGVTSVSFERADLTDPCDPNLRFLVGRPVFTYYVLEQLKYDLQPVIKRLITYRPTRVIHLETGTHLLPRLSLRFVANRLYILRRDYQDHLVATLEDLAREGFLRIRTIRRLNYAPTPKNDPILIVWQPL